MPDISVPIFDTLVHPPLGLLTRSLIPGTFTGSGNLTRPAPLAIPPFQNVNAYGLTWDIFTIASTVGFESGFPTVYEERICQLATVHTDVSGHDVISEYHEFNVEGIYWLWENAGPAYVHYEIPSNVVLVLYWLLI